MNVYIGKLGSVGLDLSYVTHIYLMEPLLDIALEDQLISRAYRLGTTQSVQVTLCIMKHTLEEVTYAISNQGRHGQWSAARSDYLYSDPVDLGSERTRQSGVLTYTQNNRVCDEHTTIQGSINSTAEEELQNTNESTNTTIVSIANNTINTATTANSIKKQRLNDENTSNAGNNNNNTTVSHYLLSQLRFIIPSTSALQ